MKSSKNEKVSYQNNKVSKQEKASQQSKKPNKTVSWAQLKTLLDEKEVPAKPIIQDQLAATENNSEETVDQTESPAPEQDLIQEKPLSIDELKEFDWANYLKETYEQKNYRLFRYCWIITQTPSKIVDDVFE